MGNTNIRFKFASPWITFVNELQAMFGQDPEIGITYDNDACEVKFHVENAIKADVLQRFLPVEKTFGNVTLKITIIPANKLTKVLDYQHMTMGELFDIMFDKNPAYIFSKDIKGIFSNVITYVVFSPVCVQFFNDNLNDIYGNVNTLYQEIAYDIFDGDNIGGVMFCTESMTKTLTTTQQQWP